jgi:hypothetical protein
MERRLADNDGYRSANLSLLELDGRRCAPEMAVTGRCEGFETIYALSPAQHVTAKRSCRCTVVNPGADMADEKTYDEARELAEAALQKLVDGDDKGAEELAQKAKETNPQAVEDVLQDLNESLDGNAAE